jgi:opacity protein-like surface antigen
MNRFLVAAVCAALLMAAPSTARAHGLGLNGGQFSMNLGVNVGITGGFSWVPGGPMCGPACGGYGAPMPYNAMPSYGYGYGGYGHGYDYSGYYGY